MVAPLLQAHVDIDAPVSDSLGVDFRFAANAAVESAMPLDEALRPAAPGHPDPQLQPPQATVLADHLHGRRGRSRTSKLAFRVDTNSTIWSYELEPNGEGTRRDREPSRRKRRQRVFEHVGECALRRDRQLRTRTARRHERVAGEHQGRRRNRLVGASVCGLLPGLRRLTAGFGLRRFGSASRFPACRRSSRLGLLGLGLRLCFCRLRRLRAPGRLDRCLGDVQHAVVVWLVASATRCPPGPECPSGRRSRTACRRCARRRTIRCRTPRTSRPGIPPTAGRSRSRGTPAWWTAPSPSRGRSRRCASVRPPPSGPTRSSPNAGPARFPRRSRRPAGSPLAV